MDDLEKYLVECIEPTIADFEKEPASVRRAFLVCVTTFHGIDYLAYPSKPGNMRRKWRNTSPAFELVDEIAHAFKHVTTGRRENANLNANAVVARQGSFEAEVFSSDFDVGSVTLERDPSINVLKTVKEAAAFLRTQLGTS